MPNYCFNRLTIRGKSSDVRKFFDENFEGDELLFSKSIPCIDDENWYDEHVLNWGTKWEPIETFNLNKQFERGLMVVEFFSAWSPPDLWFEKVTTQYNCLSMTLSWDEPGMMLKGCIHSSKGIWIKNTDVSTTMIEEFKESDKEKFKKEIEDMFKKIDRTDLIERYKQQVYTKFDAVLQNPDLNTLSRFWIYYSSINYLVLRSILCRKELSNEEI